MKTKIYLKGFQGLEHHLSFIDREADAIIGKFDLNDKFNTSILAKTVNAHSMHGHNFYECEVRVTSDKTKKVMFIRKVSNDFYSAVKLALKAIEKSLRRESKIRVTRNRKVNLGLMPIAVLSGSGY